MDASWKRCADKLCASLYFLSYCPEDPGHRTRLCGWNVGVRASLKRNQHREQHFNLPEPATSNALLLPRGTSPRPFGQLRRSDSQPRAAAQMRASPRRTARFPPPTTYYPPPSHPLEHPLATNSLKLCHAAVLLPQLVLYVRQPAVHPVDVLPLRVDQPVARCHLVLRRGPPLAQVAVNRGREHALIACAPLRRQRRVLAEASLRRATGRALIMAAASKIHQGLESGQKNPPVRAALARDASTRTANQASREGMGAAARTSDPTNALCRACFGLKSPNTGPIRGSRPPVAAHQLRWSPTSPTCAPHASMSSTSTHAHSQPLPAFQRSLSGPQARFNRLRRRFPLQSLASSTPSPLDVQRWPSHICPRLWHVV